MPTATPRDNSDTIEYNPFSPEAIADPYPIYRSLVDVEGVYYNPGLDFYALTRYEDIVTYGRDWKTFSYTHGADIDDVGEAFGPGNFLEEDPPIHTLLRGVVKRAFVPKDLRALMEEFIESEIRALVSGFVERGGGDFASDFAWLLPMKVISYLLGLPPEDLPFLAPLQHDFSRKVPGQRTIPAYGVKASEKLRGYMKEQVLLRESQPRDDLLTVIWQARDEIAAEGIGDPIETLASLAFLLWSASIETTACNLSNTVVLLGSYPEQRSWLKSHPEQIPDAVEEILRFQSPLQILRRTTTEPVEIRGTSLEAGAMVGTVFGAANRDPRKFESPDVFDLTRKPTRNLAFGDGIHHCLGAPLARLEAQIAIAVLLELAPEYEVDLDGLERLSNYIVHGYVGVPVSIGG